MSRHCRHCRPGCQGASPVRFGAPRKHYDLDYSAWSDGRCPACAEAERIEATITATIPDEYPGITDQETMQLLSEVFAECADIARGEA